MRPHEPRASGLRVRGLAVRFRTRGGTVQALTDCSFELEPGETLVVIGESGSGKTVLAQALMRLLPMNSEPSGSVLLGGTSLLDLTEEEMRQVRRRRMALIPQSAGAALNPVRRIGSLMLEAATNRGLSPAEAREQLTILLGELGLDFEEIAQRYPHQLSGGMQQRVVNALAMIGQPELVIADEPTHGLDAELVDTTAEQLRKIVARGAALLVITHDLRLAERLGGRLALLYASHVVELSSTPDFFERPLHPYGQDLLGAMPERGGRPIPGLSPELTALPPGCVYAPRCQQRLPACDERMPAVTPAGTGLVRCHHHAPR